MISIHHHFSFILSIYNHKMACLSLERKGYQYIYFILLLYHQCTLHGTSCSFASESRAVKNHCYLYKNQCVSERYRERIMYESAASGTNMDNKAFLCGTRGEDDEDTRGEKDVGDGIQEQLAKVVQPLQDRIKELEKQTVKKYPEVRYLPESGRKRILITGGAGFVGSHLTDSLMMQGHEVTVVDNFFTGRKRNIEHWVGHPNFELINHDVVEPLLIEVDQIYHLACPASPPHYMYNPIKTIKTSSLGMLNMLGLAKRTRARILQASTSEVYGDPQEHPQNEEYWGHVNPIGPRACYDEGKRVAETMCYAYAKQDKVEVRVARIFNTFGPRMHMNDGRVVSNFILQSLQNEPITVYGSGKQSRSFQYVSDLVSGLIKLMNSDESTPVNLGNPEEHTIMEFAEIIKSKIGGDSGIKNVAAAEDDPQRRKPDISKAKRILGWEPVVPLDEGLKKTIDYFRAELEHAERMKEVSSKLEI